MTMSKQDDTPSLDAMLGDVRASNAADAKAQADAVAANTAAVQRALHEPYRDNVGDHPLGARGEAAATLESIVKDDPVSQALVDKIRGVLTEKKERMPLSVGQPLSELAQSVNSVAPALRAAIHFVDTAIPGVVKRIHVNDPNDRHWRFVGWSVEMALENLINEVRYNCTRHSGVLSMRRQCVAIITQAMSDRRPQPYVAPMIEDPRHLTRDSGGDVRVASNFDPRGNGSEK
jgi:hypothetical protein